VNHFKYAGSVHLTAARVRTWFVATAGNLGRCRVRINDLYYKSRSLLYRVTGKTMKTNGSSILGIYEMSKHAGQVTSQNMLRIPEMKVLV
jgi:hypothetical protein